MSWVNTVHIKKQSPEGCIWRGCSMIAILCYMLMKNTPTKETVWNTKLLGSRFHEISREINDVTCCCCTLEEAYSICKCIKWGGGRSGGGVSAVVPLPFIANNGEGSDGLGHKSIGCQWCKGQALEWGVVGRGSAMSQGGGADSRGFRDSLKLSVIKWMHRCDTYKGCVCVSVSVCGAVNILFNPMLNAAYMNKTQA